MRRLSALALALLLPGVAAAQDLPVGIAAGDAFSVTGTLGERLIVESDGESYLCDLSEESDRVRLDGCIPIVVGDGAAPAPSTQATEGEAAPGPNFEQAPEPAPEDVVGELAQAEVAQALLRVIKAQGCSYSVADPGAEDALVNAVGADLGVSADTLEAARADLFVKVDMARLTLLSAGTLTMDDAGERMLTEGCK